MIMVVECGSELDRRKRCDHADAAANKAVKQTFAILGVDIDRPEQVREFQQSLRFGELFHNAAKKGLFTLVSAIIGGLAVAMWYGFKISIGKDL